jgi:hypothetical protein
VDISVTDERIPKTDLTVNTINQNNAENGEDFRRDEKRKRNQARLDRLYHEVEEEELKS